MSETLEIGGLTFEIRRSTRRKTLGITVDRSGALVLHAPQMAPDDALVDWARTKLLWVHRKLALKHEAAPRVREPEFVTGETFRYLGRAYRLAVVSQQDEPLHFDGRRFFLRRDATALATDHFRRWYIGAGSEWIAKRVALLARRMGASPTRVEVRDLGFRWGSCGKGGVMFLNWRLFQLPVRLVDYVVAHELAHLVEAHHGPAFWTLLDRSLPDWREREQELRGKAADAYWCHEAMGPSANVVRTFPI